MITENDLRLADDVNNLHRGSDDQTDMVRDEVILRCGDGENRYDKLRILNSKHSTNASFILQQRSEQHCGDVQIFNNVDSRSYTERRNSTQGMNSEVNLTCILSRLYWMCIFFCIFVSSCTGQNCDFKGR